VWRGALHAKSQLVGFHSRVEFLIGWVLRRVVMIDRFQKIEAAALALIADVAGWSQVKNRRAFLLKLSALIGRGEKSGAPVRGPAAHHLVVGKDDKRGQVPVGGAQA